MTENKIILKNVTALICVFVVNLFFAYLSDNYKFTPSIFQVLRATYAFIIMTSIFTIFFTICSFVVVIVRKVGNALDKF